MKRWTVILGILFSFAFGAAGNESFLITVPVREVSNAQTGEVRITLGLDAPPNGAQLVLNETTTVNLGQTVTAGGEPVTFEAGDGNEARIVYRPLQNFPTPGNFCASPGIQRELQVRFVGPQDIVDYRISSYAVGAPDFECSVPFKRVGDFPAFITPLADATTPELTANNKARHEIDLVLVLDKSGSMSGLPPEFDSGPAKAELLRSAIQAFIAQWRELDAVDAEAPEVEFAEDRIGLVFFDGVATPQNVNGTFFTPRGPDVQDHSWLPVMTEVANLLPGGTTSIGGGINTAMQQWANDPDHDLSLIVVTDGIQNTEPLIETVVVDADTSFLTLEPVGTFSEELRKRGVPIFTIGFGLPSGVDQALLQNISAQTTGLSFIALDSSTLVDSLGQTLVGFLKGNTISTPLRRRETMSGAGPGPAHTLFIDDSVKRVVFSVQWAPPLAGALDLEVTGPGGVTPTSVSRTGQSVLHRFDLRPGSAGQWSVRVKRAQTTATQSVPYVLTAFVQESKLEYAVSADKGEPATGDAINVRARVAFENKALNKLPGGAIQVRVQRPAEGLGNILRETGAGNPVVISGDPQSPYDAKVARVDAARVSPRDVATLTLQEESPGVYTGTFTDTSVPGLYVFETTLDWTDPRTGRIHREERLEKHVKVRPDPIATIVTTARGDGDNVLVSVTPRDRFGNYVGPGYARDVRATLNGAGTISDRPVDADQTGTYTFVVTGAPAGATPDVDVTVGGVEIGKGGGASSAGKWRIFFDAGINVPHGDFGRVAGGDLSVNAGLERLLTPHWSIEFILGHHTFEHPLFEPEMTQLSLGAKYWFGSTGLRPFLGGSAGAFRLEPGDTTRAGFSGGGGVLYQLTPKLGLEGLYNYYNVNTSGDSVSFSTWQAGIRWAF